LVRTLRPHRATGGYCNGLLDYKCYDRRYPDLAKCTGWIDGICTVGV
jgi:hypothetical protein